MNSTLDPDLVLELILDHCIKICKAESGSLMLVNPREPVLDIVTYRGLTPNVEKEFRLKIGEGVTGYVAKTGKGRLVNDVSQDPYYISIKNEIKSEIAVPMIVEDVVIGVISLDSTRIDAFDTEYLEIVSVLANQAAQIFKNLQVFRNLEQKNKIQQVLLDISKVVTTTLDLKEIFQSILFIIEKTLKLEQGTLVLYDSDTDRLNIAAAIGVSKEEMEKGIYSPGEGITGTVFETGEPMLIPSISKDKLFLNRVGYLNPQNHKLEDISYLSTPIIVEQNIIGVLSVYVYRYKDVDLQTYLDFLQVVSSIISQAIKIHNLIEEDKNEISRENIFLKRELKNKYRFGSIIGRSKSMEKLFEKIKLVSESRASVLITGESGTGKEMIASAIHYNSNRADKPFIKINCAAIPENLLESELFGHKKGAFTGAVADKKGKFELADGGTIFLDEIGELDMNLQSKLLRVLQEREIEALGSIKVKKIDVRVIAATNANLEELISEKKFRSDLYYRLNVVNIHTPSLKERVDDIPILIAHFMEKYSIENSKNIKGISKEAVKILSNFHWPGNVRELENAIERAIVLTPNDVLNETDFLEISEKLIGNIEVMENSGKESALVSLEHQFPQNIDSLEGRALEVIVGEVESKLIQYALKKFKYTKTRVAKFLGINRNTLDKRIKELNIEY
ncbi:MAG: sigma 54-interacting transcriptional regulator [Leptospiraceae bacterium]|nr:sigma 54-interacting transcriptional regulator [Leptospiraceae bacterium]MCP5494050.1 sigma 54-interacting transcriptional regulator [Leptospiraceae bacterium]